MSINRTVSQNYNHICTVVKGALASQRVDYTAEVASGVTGIYQGSLVSLNTSGKFVLGLPEGTGVVYPMPMFSTKNLFDPDVSTGLVDENNKIISTSVVGGTISAYAAIGGMELETTEYDSTATYTTGSSLVAKVASSAQTGKVTLATTKIYGNTTIVGIVSRGVTATPQDGFPARLAFWPVFFPSTHA